MPYKEFVLRNRYLLFADTGASVVDIVRILSSYYRCCIFFINVSFLKEINKWLK